MIAYRDFYPEYLGIFATFEDSKGAFDSALTAANDWIDGESIEVINVESIRIGLAPPMLLMIRIWHHSTASKPASFPEV